MSSKRQRPPTGQSRVLDETRARRSSALGASGQAVGRGMTIDAKGRYETRLPRGFYWSSDGVQTMRLGGLLTLVAQSPERYDLNTDAPAMRELLRLLAPTTDDIVDASTGQSSNALIQALRSTIAAMDARIEAIEALPVAPVVYRGSASFSGTDPVSVECSGIFTGRSFVTITRTSTGTLPALPVVTKITDGESFEVSSTNILDDGTFDWKVETWPEA